ncbi:MAG TPA: hypothetical protein VF131_18065 [Blastocatellia bacterium]|nr:hypothetical protein [Blastocatellia bacterium]
MKKQVYSIFAISVLLLAASVIPANAQAARLIGANIPFNFVVKDKVLPAGDYILEPIQVGASQALKIQSADGHITAIVPVRSVGTKAIGDDSKLVFNRFGDQYFLSQVFGLEGRASYALHKSSAEERLAKEKGGSKRDVVSVTGHHQ